MKITILKNFKFAKVEYRAGQESPSKRYPTIPFNKVELKVLKDMGNISVTEAPKASPKPTKVKEEK
jgi:predicted transcriptional regulator